MMWLNVLILLGVVFLFRLAIDLLMHGGRRYEVDSRGTRSYRSRWRGSEPSCVLIAHSQVVGIMVWQSVSERLGGLGTVVVQSREGGGSPQNPWTRSGRAASWH
ncbi:hypothetical protein IIA16_00420 [bacterium]|nr:hypothetical protein [bacterium]